jgi:hypothetical protein
MPTWEEIAAAGRIREAIVSYVAAHSYTTIWELQCAFSPYIETRGNFKLGCPELKIVNWGGLSRAFGNMIVGLLDEGLLLAEPISLLATATDGVRPDLPRAKRLPKGGYRTAHWQPIALNVPGR